MLEASVLVKQLSSVTPYSLVAKSHIPQQHHRLYIRSRYIEHIETPEVSSKGRPDGFHFHPNHTESPSDSHG